MDAIANDKSDDQKSDQKQMKVCCISDTHTMAHELDVGEGDILIHSGDFTNDGALQDVHDFVDWFEKQRYTHKIIIAGNHDMIFDKDAYNEQQINRKKRQSNGQQQDKIEMEEQQNATDMIKQRLSDIPNCHYLEHASIELFGYKFFGTPYILPLPPAARDCTAFMRKEKERKELFSQIPSDTDILISHQPPKNILDSYENEPYDSPVRYGCQILRNEVLTRIKPRYHIFGHVHEGHGTISIDGVQFINAANVDDNHRCVNKPIVFYLPISEEAHQLLNQ